MALSEVIDVPSAQESARRLTELHEIAAAHEALNRKGAAKSPRLELRVIDLERQNRAAVPKNVWGGR